MICLHILLWVLCGIDCNFAIGCNQPALRLAFSQPIGATVSVADSNCHVRSVHTAACVEVCRWACLKLDQITWISRPGHTSTCFDWLCLYWHIIWLADASVEASKVEHCSTFEASNASKAKRRNHNAVRQSVTSPHSNWMGRSVAASTWRAVMVEQLI